MRRTGIENGGRTGTGAETKENVPAVRRTKTRNESGTASLTVRKEMLRFVTTLNISRKLHFI